MISIIICSIDEQKFAAVSANYARLLGDEAYEIIGIHDATSLCEGYNRGVRRAAGTILIFSHDDIEILSPDFLVRLRAHLAIVDIVGPAGTSLVIDGFWPRAAYPHIHGQVALPKEDGNGFIFAVYDRGDAALQGRTLTEGIQALDGLFFAANRKVFDRIAFDEKTFDGFHGYDIDFTYSTFLAGIPLGTCHDIAFIHYSQGDYGDAWEEYNRRFLRKHADRLPSPGSLRLSGETQAIASCDGKAELQRSVEAGARVGLARSFAAGRNPAAAPPSLLRQVISLMLPRPFRRR